MAFCLTLTSTVWQWYRRLNSRSINSFCQLSKAFSVTFLNAKIRKKETSHLYRVKQGKDESLKDYLSRFDKAIIKVKTCTDATLINAFREGVKDNKLLWAMTYDAPLSFANLRGIAQKHYGTEEYIKSRKWP
ncbi:hypothetical protein TIFTF001_027179 [Ficus carica]|uniref:Retrotransposon gag domain-containing protein n=1 Tax=Ficus carica TaxID=3494 RepID=A0AA88DMH4_FICCA|nr:hypothetical protein TIFTF001_027179 [Ficus carica]